MKYCPTCRRELGNGPGGYFRYRRVEGAPVTQQIECIECFEKSDAAEWLRRPANV